MSIFTFAIFFMAAVFESQVHFVTSDADVKCPPNSHSTQVSVCEPACDLVGKPPIPCPRIVVPGCKCDCGLILSKHTKDSSELKCVRPETCVVKCPLFMHYEPYASGCQPTCKNRKVPKPCNNPCFPQCVCNKGYLLHDITHKCVKPRDCALAYDQ